MDWFLRIWAPIALSVTCMCVLAYAAVQQSYRQGVNDPQIEMAQDAASALERGEQIATVLATGTPKIDIAASLRPYMAVYSASGTPVAWSGELDGAPPTPPIGVFEAARGTDGTRPGENRVTWQPEDDVRSAIVVVHMMKTGGYVLVGRNMREVEARMWNIQVLVGAVWILTLAGSLLLSWIGARVAAGKSGIVW